MLGWVQGAEFCHQEPTWCWWVTGAQGAEPKNLGLLTVSSIIGDNKTGLPWSAIRTDTSPESSQFPIPTR